MMLEMDDSHCVETIAHVGKEFNKVFLDTGQKIHS